MLYFQILVNGFGWGWRRLVAIYPNAKMQSFGIFCLLSGFDCRIAVEWFGCSLLINICIRHGYIVLAVLTDGCFTEPHAIFLFPIFAGVLDIGLYSLTVHSANLCKVPCLCVLCIGAGCHGKCYAQ